MNFTLTKDKIVMLLLIIIAVYLSFKFRSETMKVVKQAKVSQKNSKKRNKKWHSVNKKISR